MSGRRALFLDRDGVINVDHAYVATPERFEFITGIFDLTRAAVDLGYRVVIATNQAGIARGYYDEAAFFRLSDWMVARFGEHGVPITAVMHCPYLSGAVVPAFDRASFWRKPNPGMILEAARRLNLDPACSMFIGDRQLDMRAAEAAGIGTRLLFAPESSEACGAETVRIGRLADAVAWLGASPFGRLELFARDN